MKQVIINDENFKVTYDHSIKSLIWYCDGVFSKSLFEKILNKTINQASENAISTFILNIKKAPPTTHWYVIKTIKLINELVKSGLTNVIYVKACNSFTHFNMCEIRENIDDELHFYEVSHSVEAYQTAYNIITISDNRQLILMFNYENQKR